GVDRFAHRLRHFVRLARCEADFSLPVADGDERIEREPASALHDLGDTIDRDDVLYELAALAAPTIVAATAAAIAAAAPAAITTTAIAAAATRTTASAAAAAAATATAAAAAAATRAAATTAAARCAAGAPARSSAGRAGIRAALCLFHNLRTPIRPDGRRRPPLSRGRGICILRGRRRPS